MTCPPPPPATSTATDIAAKTRPKKKKRQGADGKPPLNIGSLAYPLASLAFSLASTLLTFARGFRRDYGSGCQRVPPIFLFSSYRVFHIILAKSYLCVALKFHDAPAYFRQESATHDFYLLVDREEPKRRLRSTNLFNLSPLVSLYSRAVSAISCYGIATVNTVSEEHVRIVLVEIREARGAKKIDRPSAILLTFYRRWQRHKTPRDTV